MQFCEKQTLQRCELIGSFFSLSPNDTENEREEMLIQILYLSDLN